MASTNFNLDSNNLATGNGSVHNFDTGTYVPPSELGTANAYHGSGSSSEFYNILSVDINLCSTTDDYYLEYNACPDTYNDWVLTPVTAGAIAYAEIDFVSKYTLNVNLNNTEKLITNTLVIEYGYSDNLYYGFHGHYVAEVQLTAYPVLKNNINIDLCSSYVPPLESDVTNLDVPLVDAEITNLNNPILQSNDILIIDYDEVCVKQDLYYYGYHGSWSDVIFVVAPKTNIDISICGNDSNPEIGFQEFNYRTDYTVICDTTLFYEAFHGHEITVEMQFPLPFQPAVGFHGAENSDVVLRAYPNFTAIAEHGSDGYPEADLTINPAKDLPSDPAEHGSNFDADIATSFAIFPRGYHGAEAIEGDILSIYPAAELPSDPAEHGSYGEANLNTTFNLVIDPAEHGSYGEFDLAPQYALYADGYHGSEGYPEAELTYAERATIVAEAEHGASFDTNTDLGITTYAILKPFPIHHGYTLIDRGDVFEFCEALECGLDPIYGDNIIRSPYEGVDYVPPSYREPNADNIDIVFGSESIWEYSWWWIPCSCDQYSRSMTASLLVGKRFSAVGYAGHYGEALIGQKLLALVEGTPDEYLYGEIEIDLENPPQEPWYTSNKIRAEHGNAVSQITFYGEWIKFCPGYIIPNGNNITFDFASPLIYTCVAYEFFHGAEMTSKFAAYKQFYPTNAEHGSFASAELTIDPPWRAIAEHGHNVAAKLSISFDFELNTIEHGSQTYAAFYEAPILGYAGHDMSAKITLPGPDLFWNTAEGACFQNNYLPITEDGDIDYVAISEDIYLDVYPRPSIVEFKPCFSIPLDAYCVLGINYDYYGD